MLAVAWDTQRTYGRTPDQLVNAGKVFNMVLGDHTVGDIREAFYTWMKRSSEVPTPFDILNLIERKGKPPLDRTLYIELTKKAADQRTSAEWEYMEDYKRYQMTGRVS